MSTKKIKHKYKPNTLNNILRVSPKFFLNFWANIYRNFRLTIENSFRKTAEECIKSVPWAKFAILTSSDSNAKDRHFRIIVCTRVRFLFLVWYFQRCTYFLVHHTINFVFLSSINIKLKRSGEEWTECV